MDNEKIKSTSLINKEIFLKYYSYDFAYEVFSRVMQTIRREK